MPPFQLINSSDTVPGDGSLPPEFVLRAGPKTDIWAKPNAPQAFNAPILFQSMPLHAFTRARVSLNAEWQQEYDQGGLLLVLNTPDSKHHGTRQWVKAGIELTHGKPHLSVVTRDRWADWSLRPIPSGGNAATLEFAREADDSLWIYLVEGEQRSPLREVTWIFEKEVGELWIGVYAAQPSEGDGLAVKFSDLVIEKR
ncbi:hypothetical protein N7492_003118 [Penicillium capsulatum]|uniref:Uncharacterized protein n=1 Tax=Penicillium capsulatum TaxID=69766 RepID=A0A9W9IIV4_9EURO|nr:hypothetical protein N7492_003118 [Penicillium capsulatum]KAJ6122292.1 hypothetical protein N7512_004757 [Penicillium capsulatum]